MTMAPPAPFRLKRFVVRSLMLGVLIGLFIRPFALFVVSAAQMTFGPEIFQSAPLPVPYIPMPEGVDPFYWFLALMLVGAPMLESLIFPPLYWLTRRLPGPRIIFVALIGIVAYVWHGMVIPNIAQANGFMLMALWYAYLSENYPSPSLLSPIKIPYYGIALAHFGWNTTVLVWSLAAGSLMGVLSTY